MMPKSNERPKKDEETCRICLGELDKKKPFGSLANCGHKFHIKCIHTVYYKKFYVGDTMERLKPLCPLCRRKIGRSDLPGLSKSVKEDIHKTIGFNPALIDQPSRVQMSREERIKLSRKSIIINRREREALLDKLIAERKRKQNLQSYYENIDNAQTSTNVIVENFASTSTYQPPLLHNINQDQEDLENIQASIYIVEDHLNRIDQEPQEAVNIGDNVAFSEDEEDDDDNWIDEPLVIVEPVKIDGHWGLGRHTKYRVIWSDGLSTLNPTREVEESIPQFLVEYRRERRKINTRNCRQRMKEARS